MWNHVTTDTLLRKEIGNRSIAICLTNECNTICRYCSCIPKWTGRGVELPYEAIVEVLKFLAYRKIGFQTLQLTGGEPLLHSRIFDVLRMARKLGFILRLQTNGFMLNSFDPNDLKELRDVAIKVSLDGINSDDHERFREKESFKKAVSGIEASLKHDLTIGVRTVFTKYNINSAGDFVPFLHQLGVTAWSYNSIRPVGHARSMGPDAEALSEYEVHKRIINHFINKKYRHLLNGTNILRHLLAKSPIVRDKRPWLLWWNGNIYTGPSSQFRNESPVANVFLQQGNWQDTMSALHPGYETIIMDRYSYGLINARLGHLHI
jgi:MoaA/NifB/PqqE/SkfB family radical SAM enzyme